MKLALTTKTMMQQTGFRLLSGVCLFSLTIGVGAGTLQLGNPTMRDGQYVFPVVLQGSDEDVAALDFRLSYDPAVFSPVSANTGRNAVQAQKQVNSNVSVPGEFVVVLMGFNQNTVAPGEVVEIVMEKIGEPAGGTTLLQIDDPTLATNVGVEVDSRGLGRTIRFSGDGEPEAKREEVDTPESDGDALSSPKRPSDSDDNVNSAGGSNVGSGAGPLFASNGGSEQAPMTSAPNTPGASAENSSGAGNSGTADGAITIAARMDNTEPGGAMPNAAPAVHESAHGATNGQDNDEEVSSSATVGVNEAVSATNSGSEPHTQTLDNKSVSTSSEQRVPSNVKGGRQAASKYATLVLLMVSVPLGIFGILRFIKH